MITLDLSGEYSNDNSFGFNKFSNFTIAGCGARSELGLQNSAMDY